MIRVTTPTILIKVNGLDSLEDMIAYVSFRTKKTNYTITKSTADEDGSVEVDGTNIMVTLTQEETRHFAADSTLYVQINLYQDGKRIASNIKELKVSDNIMNEVISE